MLFIGMLGVLPAAAEVQDNPVYPSVDCGGEWHWIHNQLPAGVESGTLTVVFAGGIVYEVEGVYNGSVLHYTLNLTEGATLVSAEDDVVGGKLVLSHWPDCETTTTTEDTTTTTHATTTTTEKETTTSSGYGTTSTTSKPTTTSSGYEEPTTTSTTAPTTTTSTKGEQEVTTTTVPTSSSSVLGITTTTTVSESSTSVIADSSTTTTVPAVTASTLPFTGSDFGRILMLGLFLAAIGVFTLSLAASRRHIEE